MPTLAGLRRRGVPPEAIRDFVRRIGVARADNLVDVAMLDHAIRDVLNRTAPRRMAVLRPLKVVIENYPEGVTEELDAVNNPEDPSAGSRRVRFSRELFIERDDFMENPPKKFFRLSPGQEVRLRYAYFVRCRDVVKNAAGEVVELRCTYDPETRGGNTPPDGRKVKATLHWVSAADAVPAEIRLVNQLFRSPSPDVANFAADLNPDSLEVLSGAMLEPAAVGVELRRADAVRAAGLFPPRPRFRARQPGLRPHRRPQGHLRQGARAGRRGERGLAECNPVWHRGGGRGEAPGLACTRTAPRGCGKGAGCRTSAALRPSRVASAGAAPSSASRCATRWSASSRSAPASNGSPSSSASDASSISRCRASRWRARWSLLAFAVGVVAAHSYLRGANWRIAMVVAVCLAGATTAKLRVDRLDGPHIETPVVAEISGRVVARESRTERRPRIVLDALHSDTLAAERLPRRIRVTLAPSYELPPLGATVSLRARLMPVAGPVVPGGYDARRAAFFEGIGASGFVLGTWQLVEPPAAVRSRPRRGPASARRWWRASWRPSPEKQARSRRRSSWASGARSRPRPTRASGSPASPTSSPSPACT